MFVFILGIISSYFFTITQKDKNINQEEVISFLPEKTTPTKTPFSLEEAPVRSLRATIATMSGHLLWESRIATQPAQLSPEVKTLQQGERIIASDSGNITLNFDLVGEITLFPNSDIQLVQTLPVNLVFNQNTGRVEYQAFGNQFTVRLHRLLVSFANANIQSSISELTGEIIVTVNRGTVIAAFNDENFVSQKVTLMENDRLIFNNEKRSAEKISL